MSVRVWPRAGLRLMIATLAWASLDASAGVARGQDPQPSSPALPLLPDFKLQANTKVALEYETVARNGGPGFMVKALKPAAGSESLTIQAQGVRPDAIKVTLKLVFEGDAGPVTTSIVFDSVADDGKGNYAAKFNDTAGGKLLDAVVTKLNNATDAGKQIKLKSCEVTLEQVPGKSGFNKVTLPRAGTTPPDPTIPTSLEHVQP